MLKIKKIGIMDIGKIRRQQIMPGSITDTEIADLADISIDKIQMPEASSKQSIDLNTVQVTQSMTSGRVYINPVYFPHPINVQHITFDANTVKSSGLIYIGLYDNNGNLVLNTTPALPVVGRNFWTIPNTKIKPGQYYAAVMGRNTHNLYMGNVLNAAVIPRQGYLNGSFTDLPNDISLDNDIVLAAVAQPWVVFSN